MQLICIVTANVGGKEVFSVEVMCPSYHSYRLTVIAVTMTGDVFQEARAFGSKQEHFQ